MNKVTVLLISFLLYLSMLGLILSPAFGERGGGRAPETQDQQK
jgi:hypothetical protein